MKSQALCSWAESKPFRFLVGSEGREFVIHGALIAAQSPALNALVNNGMQESREGCVSWPQCDVETFVRFLEYVYTGDFESPMALTHDLGGESESAEEHADAKVPKPFEIRQAVWDNFVYWLDREYTSHTLYYMQWHPEGDGDDALVAIAKVYMLADYYGVDRLARLCMFKLCELLVDTQERPSLGGLINLVELCIVEQCPTRLRKFVLEYSAFHLHPLVGEEKFQQLAKEHPSALLEILGQFMVFIGDDGFEGAEADGDASKTKGQDKQ
ncbi:hypothetical protein V2A60_004534 [Cordyceps javanica]|uniref:BTB/POZdomain-containing protein n=1 Tax=Cordyceps javanica TaxID=43265 RepID=A0A545URZ0_9HYPO|nr:BTB/POZdomain-containing protein [Cordyceps javanica]TQW03964.1 BTB/POZ domain-containing protein [Cordyceps javanica]